MTPLVLETKDATTEQRACAGGNHGLSDHCCCDGAQDGGQGPGFVCNECRFHGHYA